MDIFVDRDELQKIMDDDEGGLTVRIDVEDGAVYVTTLTGEERKITYDAIDLC